MTPADYAIDWALILVVLIQLRERRLTVTSLIRPLVIAGIAVLIYLRGIPTAGNDLLLLALAAATGLLIGARSGQTVLMRTVSGGEVLARSGWAVAEVSGRALVQALRRHHLLHAAPAALAEAV